MTNYEKVVTFNTLYGVLEKDKSKPQQQIINEAMFLIREEMKELEDAVKDNNRLEMVDALADILYVVYGMGKRIGVDMDKVFDLVHENNMSKMCKDKETAERTV